MSDRVVVSAELGKWIFLFSCIVIFAFLHSYVYADDELQSPGYSILYEQLLVLEEEGEIIEALQIIPALYAEEIPVDSFYVTLENKRSQLLETAFQRDISFPVGRESLNCSALGALFKKLSLEKTKSPQQVVDISDYFDVKRFCYLMIIEGRNQQNPVSQFDMRSALTGADPWLVSGALFVTRKQKAPSIGAQDIVDRWQSRPDLWDEECTRQALLFFTQFEEAVIKSLTITNEDIRMEAERLHPASMKN